MKKKNTKKPIKIFFFNVFRSAIYIFICTVIMVILNNKTELTNQISWAIGWLMAMIYANFILKLR